MYLRRNTAVKFCLAIVFGAVLYAEVVVYYLQALRFQDLQCLKGDPSCTKILFIADPQIQGELVVPPPLSYLFNWDSDRYLRLTFSRAVNHFQPDVLVYLGDMMDEGSIASKEQFHNYMKRLSGIFADIPYPVQQIWVPGDNDIGGENEPIRWDKVELFQTVFEQEPVIQVKGVQFYKINGITHAYPKLLINQTDETLKIAVSHYPLLVRHSFNEQIRKNFSPDIYFCGHDHESKYTTMTKRLERNRMVPFYGKDLLRVTFGPDSDVYEIYVPTCSYRMGTNKIGYGAAILDDNNSRMRYTVFWSPERFPLLYGYVALLVLFGLYVTGCLIKLCWQYYVKSRSNRLPLYSKIQQRNRNG